MCARYNKGFSVGFDAIGLVTVIEPPDDPADWDAWRHALHRWRAEARARYGDHGPRYADPAGAWSASCRVVAQIWLWDELLYAFEADQVSSELLMPIWPFKLVALLCMTLFVAQLAMSMFIAPAAKKHGEHDD